MLKRTSTWWLLIALLTAMLLAGMACKSDDNGGGGGNGNGDTPEPTAPLGTATPYTGKIWTMEEILEKDPAVTETAEVEWGFMFELSGGILSGFGEPTGDGVKLAVQEINDAGGFQVGDTIYTIKLIEKDTHANVEDTIAAATTLVQQDGVKVIWGPATVGDEASTAITQQAKVIHICPCQGREKTVFATVEDAQGPNKYAYQTLLPFSLLIGESGKSFVEDWPEAETVAFLCQNTQVGHEVCSAARDAYGGAGLEVVSEEYFPPETTDYSPFLTKLVSKNVDYLFNFADPPNDAAIVKKALELGVGEILMVSVPAETLPLLVGREITKPTIVGAAPRQASIPTSQDAADYFDRYRAFKGELPFASFVSLLTYDYVYMLVAAMQEAGSVDDTDAITEKLAALHYDGVSEDDLFFNRRHMGVHGTDPCIVQSGTETTCEHNPPPEAAKLQ
jgi:ABC-type branched-subunit amino acid transport system substrate-binding protein